MNKRDFIKPALIIVGATTLISSLGFYVWQEEHRLPLLEIYIFNLTSGRSMFIRTPEDRRIFIDGGSNSEIIRRISEIIPFYSRRIDMVIATDSKGNNISGLIDIIERYKVGEVYIPAFTLENLGLASSTDQIYETFLDILAERQIKTDELFLGGVVDLDSQTRLNVHFPVKPEKFSYSKASPPEILFTISNNRNTISFFGNATKKVQKYIANSILESSEVDVMVFSHSIIPANVSVELINKLKPKNIIFSQKILNTSTKVSTIPKNKKEIVDPLSYLSLENKFNLREKGTIKIISDGDSVSIDHEDRI